MSFQKAQKVYVMKILDNALHFAQTEFDHIATQLCYAGACNIHPVSVKRVDPSAFPLMGLLPTHVPVLSTAISMSPDEFDF